MEHQPVHYGDYLQLDKILNAQEPVSFGKGKMPAHDEMLFIVIHQAYELWFKQILFEIDSVAEILERPTLNDNSPELQMIVHRMDRVNMILKVLVQQVDILETMTPMEFLNFRDMLRPASGFQSWQFKLLEARLGLKYEQRHGQNYYLSQLNPDEITIIKNAESRPSVLELVNNWLERIPFFDIKYWEGYSSLSDSEGKHPFWADYRHIWEQSLSPEEKNNIGAFDKLILGIGQEEDRQLSSAACRAALFIMSYRGYPMLELPFRLLDILLETDNQLGSWRYRHINMVRRMIGGRIGTGGSTGAGYLQGAMEKHYIFREFSQLNSFLMESRKLPVLPEKLTTNLGYKS
jgi:tryptophan 2,3-dioxygenase